MFIPFGIPSFEGAAWMTMLYFGVWVHLPRSMRFAIKVITAFFCVVGLMLIWRVFGDSFSNAFGVIFGALWDIIKRVPSIVIFAFTGK